MRHIYLFGVIFSLTTNCVTKTSLYPPSVPSRTIESFEAEGDQAAIATSHPIASEAALLIFNKGGNIVDAAVAASFAISVVRPHSTGIGGGGFLLHHDAKQTKTDVYDFRERAPMKASRNMYITKNGNSKDFYYKGKRIKNASVNGHLAVGVPGLVHGLLTLHKNRGSLPLSDILAPAIKAAEEGFRVYKSLASALQYRGKVMLNFESTRKVFFPNGTPLKVGDLLVQKDLGTTLRLIAKNGMNGFYRGDVANKIIAEMKKGRGLIRHSDLRNYKTKMRTPVKGSYRGFKIISMPPPSSGGTHIVQMLNMLENYDVKSLGHNTASSIHLLTEIMRRAFADRGKYLGDPDFVKVPIDGLTAKGYAKQLIHSIDSTQASSSKIIGAGNPIPYESDSTTHFSIIDKHGNAISSTQTINYGFGSGVVAEGTGIILNNEMDDFSKKPGVPNVFGLIGGEANAIAAKKTMLSSMSPTLVFGKDGLIYLAVGSPGGPRIINATLQTIINIIDHNMSLQEAVHAHRIHHQWLPDVTFTEPNGLPTTVTQALKKSGHTFKERINIGDVQAVMKTTNTIKAVSDSRSEGQPKAY